MKLMHIKLRWFTFFASMAQCSVAAARRRGVRRGSMALRGVVPAWLRRGSASARRGHHRRHELFWTRSPSKPSLCMVQANWPRRCTGALRHYRRRRRRCHATSRRQTNAATNKPPPTRLGWSVLVHTSDQRSHADFPSLPDASSHSSFIFFFDFTFTHIPIAIPQYIYLEQ